MILTIYTRPDGAYVLVPDSIKALRDAETRHGPLTHCERIDSDDFLIASVWSRVFAEIDDHLFAVVQPAIGRYLLGVECPGDPAFA